MATTAEYLKRLDQAMTPQNGLPHPNKQQTETACVWALAAIAAAITETGTPPDLGTVVRSAIRHSH